MLDHERLEVYQLARVLAREGNELIAGLRGARGDLVDQLRRASLSVALNIAEGAGEFAPREKARFYRMAKRSATECGAVLDHVADLGFATPQQTAAARTLLRRIVGALVKLIQSTERPAPGAQPAPPAPSPEPARAPATCTGPGTGPRHLIPPRREPGKGKGRKENPPGPSSPCPCP